jgi:hypothetical protein
MKYYQQHTRIERKASDKITYINHCISYIKAKNKTEALEIATKYYNPKILKDWEIYVLEVSKKTIKDQAGYYLQCSEYWKNISKDKTQPKISIHAAKVSAQANKNWAKKLTKLTYE